MVSKDRKGISDSLAKNMLFSQKIVMKTDD